MRDFLKSKDSKDRWLYKILKVKQDCFINDLDEYSKKMFGNTIEIEDIEKVKSALKTVLELLLHLTQRYTTDQIKLF